jgi:pimeloyl-ACP methyl ester carboxylesterase
VHGFHGSTAEWGLLAGLLSQRCDVWAVELRGHGCSGSTPDGPEVGTTADQLDVISAAANLMGDQPLELVASSYGGYLASIWAVGNQPRLHRVVLLGPALVPLHWSWRLWPIRAAMRSARVLYREELRRDEELRTRTPATFLDEATPHVSAIPEDARAALLALYLARADDPQDEIRKQQRARSLVGLVRGVTARSEMTRTLSELRRPVLWMHGTDDLLVRLDLVRPLAAKFPDWNFMVLEQVGHVPQLEAATRTATAILSASA